MRVLPVVLAALAASLLSACASRPPTADAPPSPAPVAVGKFNRFEMTQNGRRMSADDFDRWMKARGIRIAQGAPASARKPAPKAPPRAQSRSTPQAQAKAAPKPPAKPAATRR